MSAVDRAGLIARLPPADGEAPFGLRVHDPWQLLIAALLQPRTSAVRAEQVAAVVVERWASPAALADAHPRELESLLRRLPAARDKARWVVESARVIRDRHRGSVPSGRDALLLLPGVDRRIAGLVQALAYGIPAVIPDEAVLRVLWRLGWIEEENALAAEVVLQEEIELQAWVAASDRLGALGRRHCRPCRPHCQHCPVSDDCPQRGVAERPGRSDRGR